MLQLDDWSQPTIFNSASSCRDVNDNRKFYMTSVEKIVVRIWLKMYDTKGYMQHRAGQAHIHVIPIILFHITLIFLASPQTGNKNSSNLLPIGGSLGWGSVTFLGWCTHVTRQIWPLWWDSGMSQPIIHTWNTYLRFFDSSHVLLCASLKRLDVVTGVTVCAGTYALSIGLTWISPEALFLSGRNFLSFIYLERFMKVIGIIKPPH